MPKPTRQSLGIASLGIVFALLVVSCGKEVRLPTNPTAPPPPPLQQRSTGPIAFVSNRDGANAIYLANEDGSTVTRLVGASVLSYPAWSPDRRRLAFVRQPDGIFVINVDGSGLRRIWSEGRTWGPVDWSPDGTKIAFMACCGTDSGIFLMNGDGSEVTRLVGHEVSNTGVGPACDGESCGVESPTWSPDGKEIAFVSWEGYGGFNNLMAIGADDAQRRFVLSGDGLSPAWSPDGTTIAFRTVGLTREIGLVSAAGSGRPLFRQVVGDDPRWAPDGSLMVSALNETGRMRVFITTGTGSRRQLIPEATAPASPGYEDCCAVWAR